MKLNTQPRVGIKDPGVQKELGDHATLVNLIADGKLAGTNYTATTAPTTGTHARGDFVKNSAPAEAGAGGSKYVVFGWQCLDDDPLTFVEVRYLTGN